MTDDEIETGIAVELTAQDDDIGVSTPDAQAIKHCILESIQAGYTEVGDASTLAADLIDAFKAVDAQVFRRSELEKRLTTDAK